MNIDQTALIRGAAEMVSTLLQNSPQESQRLVAQAIDQGNELGVLIVVVPKPKVCFLMLKPEGSMVSLLEIELHEISRH
jgi:hypothetical protein